MPKIARPTVLVRNFAPGPTWLPGELLKRTGPVSFTAQLSDDRVVRRHQDHILSRTCNRPISELVASPTRMEHRILLDIPTSPSTTSEPTNAEAQPTDTVESPVKSTQPLPTVELDSACVPTTPECSAHQSATPMRRYSTRLTRGIPPPRLDL